MVKTDAVANHDSASTSSLDRTFDAFERFIKNLATPGGRIFVLLILVLGGYIGAAVGVSGAESLGAASLIVLLLVLARDPRSPGLLTGLLTLLKKQPPNL